MPTAITIVFVGCTIFLSHYFGTLFTRTKIPDVLWLFTIGLLLGPVGCASLIGSFAFTTAIQ